MTFLGAAKALMLVALKAQLVNKNLMCEGEGCGSHADLGEQASGTQPPE